MKMKKAMGYVLRALIAAGALCFSGSYAAAAKEVTIALEDTEDTSWAEIKLKALPPLAVGGKAACIKHGDSMAVYFPTFQSFSASSGYVYFSDETARDFFEHPAKYDGTLSPAPAYDRLIDYSTRWAYAELY